MTPEIVNHYLVVYDAEHQNLLAVYELGADTEAALEAYANAEREYSKQERVEIVLFGADSLDSIRQTHPHYFGGAEDDFFTHLAVADPA
jgi:galactose-1-phosphate uridylyltransferase